MRNGALAACLACIALATSAAQAAPPKRHLELLSPPYTVDGVYRSMTGPQSSRELRLIHRPGELLPMLGGAAAASGR
jgi:hypothetical protein